MKISKLFHWLYAILMFLPILIFVPNAFYYGFNHEAVAQEKTTYQPIYYSTNEVTSSSDLILGNIYHYSNNLTITAPSSNQYLFDIKNTDNLRVLNIPSNAINLYTYVSTNGRFMLTYRVGNNGYDYNLNLTPIDFVITAKRGNYSYISNFIDKFSASTLLLETGEYAPYETTNMSITDSMSYAWKSVWQNDLFSWTDNTFLKQPFVYITDLFSIPSDNVLINALSYWLDISIIWLVFDVIMYVPLLTHRWLDKGIVE